MPTAGILLLRFCFESIVARFKIGHTPRKNPPFRAATSRFIAYLLQSCLIILHDPPQKSKGLFGKDRKFSPWILYRMHKDRQRGWIFHPLCLSQAIQCFSKCLRRETAPTSFPLRLRRSLRRRNRRRPRTTRNVRRFLWFPEAGQPRSGSSGSYSCGTPDS